MFSGAPLLVANVHELHISRPVGLENIAPLIVFNIVYIPEIARTQVAVVNLCLHSTFA